MNYKSFASAAMNYFGKKPNTGLAEFQAELKALTDADRQDIANGLASQGITIDSMPATGTY